MRNNILCDVTSTHQEYSDLYTVGIHKLQLLHNSDRIYETINTQGAIKCGYNKWGSIR